MRRSVLLRLAGLVLLTLILPLNAAASEKEYRISAVNLLNNVQGEGFYDTSDSQTPEKTEGCLVLRQNEWARYSIANIPNGDYVLYAETSSASSSGTAGGIYGSSFSVFLDGKLKLLEKTVGETATFGTFRTDKIGEITKNGEEYLQITCTSSGRSLWKNLYLKKSDAGRSIAYFKDKDGRKKAGGLSDASYICGNITVYDENIINNEICFISAFYDEENRLICAEKQNLSGTAGEEIFVCIPLNVLSNAFGAKCFLLTDTGKAKPLCEAKKITKSRCFYVSAESGSDENDGTTKDSPFKTIERAKQAVREINDKMNSDIYVYLSGEFFIDETLNFNEKDSGKNGYSVIWQGESATFTGGKKVTGWSEVLNTPLYSAKVDEGSFRQLYINGNRGVRSKSKWFYFPADEYDKNEADGKIDGFVLNAGDFPDEFKKAEDMEIVWLPSWKVIRMKAKGMDYSGENPVITFDESAFYRAQLNEGDSQPKPASDIPFYIENAPEFLDEAGEWYFNSDTKMLYYYPQNGEDMENADVVIPKTEVLLNIENCENVSFEGIDFCYGAWEEPTENGFVTNQAEELVLAVADDGTYETKLIPAQIQINGGKNIIFKNNEFSHLGSVALSVLGGAKDCKIYGNLFDDVSASAITAGSPKHKLYAAEEELEGGIYVENNLFRRCAVEYMTPVITGYYVFDTHILHNDIEDAPYTGISLGWGWGSNVICCRENEIAYNKISNVLYKLKDGGHIYTLGDMKNTTIHDNYMVKSGEWKGGIYLDNASANITCFNNVFDDCICWLKLTYANIYGNTAYNNFADCLGVNKYPDQNSIETATAKTNGVWGDAAQKIIENAGLTEEYTSLLTEYNKKTGIVNDNLKRLSYIAKNGIIKQAGDVMAGGEGEAYHDLVGNDSGIGIEHSYDGTGHLRLMNTRQGEWVNYEVNVPTSGEYKMYLCAASRADTNAVSIYIDGKLAKEKHVLTNTGGYDASQFVEQEILSVNLSAGRHIIKIEQAVGNVGLHSFRLEKSGTAEFTRNDGFIAKIVNAVCKAKD